ncbi:MAG: beta-galactosidase [Lachnospiraceae bacterium]|nr:beta-galactosidase [Lachnospiraceae bacterium]
MAIHFGVDYYPEHWPAERWETDAKLMQEMGIRVVRLAEFSWHKMEPREGSYDFAWLDEAVKVLGEKGIVSILGTPSAAPPAWMIHKHPEIQPVDREGRVHGFGGRHHDCQSNATYRSYCRQMVTNMAHHFKDNPYVVGWQIDNELGNSHDGLCYCDSCKAAFQKWLAKKYGTVEELNKAWGTAFWSQEYNAFEEVIPPRLTAAGDNPSCLLDWRLFHSDLVLDFATEQIDILRKMCPKQFITHNCMGFADTINYYDLGKKLDFVSHDQYPDGYFVEGSHVAEHINAAGLDVIRSYKQQSFWIMEQQSGITGWEMMGRNPRPGQLSAFAMQSIGHGADAVVFFRWRSCSMGEEQYWHGILPHHGNPDRRYYELQRLTQNMFSLMEEMEGATPASRVGIVFSFAQNYAIRIQPQVPDFRYLNFLWDVYKAFYDLHVDVDFVPEDGEFDKYDLLVAPLQYLMSDELAHKYTAYTEKGGHLLLTFRSGVKDRTNICYTDGPLPGKLQDLAGVSVEEYDPLYDISQSVSWDGTIFPVKTWADVLKADKDTQVLATYEKEFYAGAPAITCHPVGKGACYYLGCDPSGGLMKELAERLLSESGIRGNGNADPGVELITRSKGEKTWLFAINFTGENKEFHIAPDYERLGSAGSCENGDTGEESLLSPYESRVYVKTMG